MASQLRALTIWISDRVETRWLDIEKSICISMPLSAVPFTEDKASEGSLGRWSETTVAVWREVQRSSELSNEISVLSSIAHLKGFLPLRLDAGYTIKNLNNAQ